jgi:anti-sigma B factor antagonist
VEITEQITDSCVILEISGRLDTATHGALDAKLKQLLAGDRSRVLVDCSKLGYVSSSGLRVFLTGLKAFSSKPQGKFTLCGLQENIREIFEISGFTGLFEIYPDREQALGTF